ncbi:hypothetical protein, partial [Pseudomonas gingeri]
MSPKKTHLAAALTLALNGLTAQHVLAQDLRHRQILEPGAYAKVSTAPTSAGVFLVKPHAGPGGAYEAYIQPDGSAVPVYTPALPPPCLSCMPPNVAVPPLQVSQPTPIFSRPVNPNARYLGTTAEGGTWWEAPIAPTSQPPLSQGTPAPQPIATNIGIVETNLSNIAANTAAIQASAHSIAGHDKRITDNTTAHQTNASNIADHDKRITDNTTAHQTNASSIAGHDNRITDNTTAHQTNAS